jgi:hypothetical protein
MNMTVCSGKFDASGKGVGRSLQDLPDKRASANGLAL